MKSVAGLLLWLLVFASLMLAQGEELAPVRLQVLLADQTGNPQEARGWLTLEPMQMGSGAPGSRQIDIEVPGTALVHLPPGSQWYASLEAPGFWSPRQLLRVGAVHAEAIDAAATVIAFPTGSLQGSLQVPAGEEMPEAVSIRFQPAPAETHQLSGELSGEVTCGVVEHRLDCEVPAGSLDLRLRAAGFVSHYWWDATVRAGQIHPLGRVSLLPGASMVGWVDSAEEGFQAVKVAVQLEPDWAGARPGDQRLAAALRQEAGINERGFFEFTGLAAGSYRVTATHPGLASAVMASVRVFERAETEIHSLTLRPPGELEVTIQPPTDPFLVPWTVALQRDSSVPGRSDEVAQHKAEDGLAVFEKLEPGLYRLLLRDSRGSSWSWQDVTVTSGFNYQEVVLPIMRLAGRVTLGDEPLPEAEVWFGGRFGARKIGVTTREDGDFYAFVPVQESWQTVDVWADQGKIQATFHDVAVPERREDQRWPEIVLKLPDTRLEGEVVDEQGQPVEATVLALQEETTLEARATEGLFEFRGLETGVWHLEAQTIAAPDSDQRTRSEVVRVELREGLEPAPVRLVLRPVVAVNGQVINDQGHGVPGAHVVGIVEQASDLRVGMQIPETFTDASGAFELEVPATTQRLTVNVFPPGFAATRVTTTLPDHDTLLISVQQNGGEVVLHFPPGERMGALRQQTSLFHNGQIVAHPWAWFRWAELHGLRQLSGSSFTVPMMEPGTYTACFALPVAVKLTGRLPAGFEEACVSGELSAYGQLVLDVPAPAETSPSRTGT